MLSDKLETDLGITNKTGRNMIINTFLLPLACSSFASGWLSDRFGSRLLGLASTIISIPAFIWIGVPNQDIQSVVSALVVGGFTMAGIIISLIFDTIQVMQTVILKQLSDRTKEQQEQYLQQQFTVFFALICAISSTGFFSGFFLSNLNYLVSFFWLCFCSSMLLGACIPLKLYLSKSTVRKGHQSDTCPNIRKKTIINSTRPASFAGSILSDDETTLGSPTRSVCNINIKPKPVMVTP
jgi:MFS family permease